MNSVMRGIEAIRYTPPKSRNNCPNMRSKTSLSIDQKKSETNSRNESIKQSISKGSDEANATYQLLKQKQLS